MTLASSCVGGGWLALLGSADALGAVLLGLALGYRLGRRGRAGGEPSRR